MIYPNRNTTKATKEPTTRASRHTLRKLYDDLAASCRGNRRHSAEPMEFAQYHSHGIAGDVYATHPELIASPTSSHQSDANASFTFFRNKRRHSGNASPKPSATDNSPPSSVIFISCRVR